MSRKLYKWTPLRFSFSGVFFLLSFSVVAQDLKPQVDRSSLRDGALFRSRRIEKTKLSGTCNDLKTLLEKWSFFGTPYSDARYEQAWKPWSKSDREAIEGCDSFPCDVKLDSNEVSQMRKADKGRRKKIFFDLVSKRVAEYSKTDVRREYEFQGNPVDPWVKMPEWEREQGKPIEISAPKAEKRLFFRYHRFTDDSYRPIRQIFDVRYALVKNGELLKMSWLVRDVYTAHYFDGWGERIEVSCNDTKKEVVLDQAMLVEFDLYKKTDLFSRMSHKTMTSKLEELTGVYQATERASLFKGSGLAELAPSPRPRY